MNEFTLPTPNDEQLKAIQHHGGVLLSAGAGSGKTFVLVEHIIYLIEEFIQQNNTDTDVEFKKKIKQYLAKIVLTTFTNKAANELRVRVKKRLKLQIQASAENVLWQIAGNAINSLYIGTIHGLCHKLLSGGMINQSLGALDIISANEYRIKIATLINNWIDSKISEQQENNITLKTMIFHKDQLIDSYSKIFGSPELRNAWNQAIGNETFLNDNEELIYDIFECLDVNQLFLDDFGLAQYDKDIKKSWFQALDYFQKNRPKGKSIQCLNFTREFFLTFKRIMPPRDKEKYGKVIEIIDKFKTLRKLFKDNFDDFDDFYLQQNSNISEWAKYLKGLFLNVEKNYLNVSGTCFSDLEYYTHQALNDTSIVDLIRENYSYFIIDEFQDTSTFQFSIFKKLIRDDFKKLFCVGDIKQAIYGFRGGELGVFLSCKEKIPTFLELKNNYRSLDKIIEFNNQFFAMVFPLNENFVGVDKDKQDFTPQSIPPNLSARLTGDIFKIVDQLPLAQDGGKIKYKKKDYEKVEANNILQHILETKQKHVDEKICILYKSLSPSSFLITELINNNIGFTAQIKIPLETDPIIGMFKLLLEVYTENDRGALSDYSYYSFVFTGLCYYLDIEVNADFTILLQDFIADYKIYDLKYAFKVFISKLGFSSSSYENNFELCDSIAQTLYDDSDKILEFIDENKSNKISLEYQFGADANMVNIMTVHSSKGLEFDHVILGGITTNGRRMSDAWIFGRIPGSFKWKDSSKFKKFKKTPGLILEGLIDKKKDFSESKRLLYVACTRAVKTLSHVELTGDAAVTLSDSKNSWINANIAFDKSLVFEYSLKNYVTEKISMSQDKMMAPLFQRAPLGIVPKSSGQIILIPELSVTRLCTLVKCPRKFYLESICKIDDEDLESIADLVPESNNIEVVQPLIPVEKGISSSKRGTRIHNIISNAILQSFNLPAHFDSLDEFDQKAIAWGIEQIKLREEGKNCRLISEEKLKFPFFNHIITGIPDLVFLFDNEICIWDFKTGTKNNDKQIEYVFQLKVYAYALYLKYSLKTQITICYLDDQVLESFYFDIETIRDDLYQVWGKMTSFNTVNKNHCFECQYNKICSGSF